jgi:hypothetical protein
MQKYDDLFLKNQITGHVAGLTDVIADLRSKEKLRNGDYVRK